MACSNFSRQGFSLVETVVGLGVMALVITGGLIAIGQASLISEKSSAQVMADMILRGEVEAIRAASWLEVTDHQSTIETYREKSMGAGYPHLLTANADALLAEGFRAEVTAAQLNAAGQTGKRAFRISLHWEDRSGKSHEEARVLIVTEGGISAET